MDESKIYTKAIVEKMPFGKCDLSIPIGYAIWQEDGRANRLLDSILKIIYQANDIGIECCAILRLTIVTSNFSDEVIEWAKHFGETWRGSSENAVGQTLTWGDGQIIPTSLSHPFQLLIQRSCSPENGCIFWLYSRGRGL